MLEEEKISEDTMDYHRAIQSLIEELQAVDWYNRRIDSTDDEALGRLLAHNRDEEKEHASMLLEFISRRDPIFKKNLQKFLFAGGEIKH